MEKGRQPISEQMIGIKDRLVESLKILNGIWDDIGLADSQKDDRVDLVFMYIRNLIDEMVTEEEKRRTTLNENIESYKDQLEKLCAELHVSPKMLSASKLFEVERELKQEVSLWQDEKESRLNELKSLKAIEQALCDVMHTTPYYIPSSCVPTKEQLDELRKHTDTLATEKAKRYSKFLESKERITRILKDLGEEVVTEFEMDVVIEDPECFVLSESNMVALKVLVEQMEVKLSNRIKHMQSLKEEIEALWNRLDIPKEERDAFNQKMDGHTQACVDLLKEELERCEKLKFEHLQDFITKIRGELINWWDRCHYSTTQRDAFTPFTSENYSEELLTQHENALEAVKQFYVENEELLKKIEKRTELWNQMVKFDQKENDPNRFKNRGGNLLAEEREKKKVLHLLPKVEEQLKNEVEEWEKEHDRQFLIGGVQFFEYCRLQWEEYKNSKELQRQQRIEQKEKEMQAEIRYGSKPTPSKRRFGGMGSNTTDSKQRKLNDTTRSATRIGLHGLSGISSVFASPALPSRTPSKLSQTPKRKTPMGPPRTPLSLRSSARKLNETGKAVSCVSLASPALKKSQREFNSMTKSASKMKKAQSERRLNEKKAVPMSSLSDEIVSQTSQVSGVEPIASSYEEFENVLHSAKKSKQYRSTLCPK